MTTIRYVETSAGVTIATEARGDGERGTILLLMGATASMVWWPDTLLEALAQAGFAVIRYDHRDTGLSTTNPPGDIRYTLDDLAGDAVAILDAYGVKEAHFVGMSLGGLLAQTVASKQPDRVLSLTLISAEPVGVDYLGAGISDAFMAHFGAMGELDWSDPQAVSDFMLRIAELSAGSSPPFDAEKARTRVDLEISRSSSIQSAFNHSLVGGDLEDLNIAQIASPLLVIHGSEDPIISINAAHASATAVQGAELLVLEGRGHELLEADVPTIASAIIAHTKKGPLRALLDA